MWGFVLCETIATMCTASQDEECEEDKEGGGCPLRGKASPKEGNQSSHREKTKELWHWYEYDMPPEHTHMHTHAHAHTHAHTHTHTHTVKGSCPLYLLLTLHRWHGSAQEKPDPLRSLAQVHTTSTPEADSVPATEGST